ncbi:serine/threonine protein kinase [Streptomyces sp. NK08204]|uniref:serine/threonine protein kinase n=1 Tax=Streptomyces sp. NK08204 TaxID=2873260 RepID=UPI001CEDD0DC|nr:serine/threonine protein kinase [Streptomyces sp. NK08204]
MEQLRQDDPRWIGPYAVLAGIDEEHERQRTPDRRFVARSADGWRTVLVHVPRTETDPARWAAEAEHARGLSVPGFAPVTEVASSALPPWYAAPYVPVLPLPAALAIHGGPLPETVVRDLGAALASALATAHAQGVTHAGLAPAAVLLSADGPLLTCFGAVRAVAPDGERRLGRPGLDPGCLAPEQAQGGRPRPLGDVYALGAVLSYASTGHTVPEREELPTSLREPITACLARDAAHRPSAAELAADLAAPTLQPQAPQLQPQAPPLQPHTPPRSPAPVPTVLDGRPFPLPARIVAALARQSAAVLVARPAADPQQVGRS